MDPNGFPSPRASDFLVIRALSGEVLAEFSTDFPSVKSLIQKLASPDISRFRLRLVREDNSLCADDEALKAGSLQLMILPLCNDRLLGKQLRTACGANKLEEVEGLLHLPINPNLKTKSGETALHVAAARGNLPCVQVLIEAGAEAGATAFDWRRRVRVTPLSLAARHGHMEVLRVLLEACSYGPEPLVSALDEAVFGGDVEVCSALLQNGPLPLCLPWMQAAELGHWEILQLFLKFGVQRDQCTQGGRAAIHVAAETGQLEAVRLLLEAGTPVDLLTQKSAETALHFAAENGNLELTQLLLDSGANPDHRSSGQVRCRQLFLNPREERFVARSCTPLELAEARGYKEVVRALLKKRATTATSDDDIKRGWFAFAGRGLIFGDPGI